MKLLSAFLALVSSSPASDAKHDSILKALWRNQLVGNYEYMNVVGTKDPKFQCDQQCVDEPMCPCESTNFGYDEMSKITPPVLDNWNLTKFEPTIYHDQDGKTCFVKLNISATNKKTGKPLPFNRMFEVVTFNDDDRISNVNFALPSTAPDQLRTTAKTFLKDFVDDKDVMKYFDPSITVDCAQSCVDADWCACDKTYYDSQGLSKLVKKMQSSEFQKNYQDIMIDGKTWQQSSSRSPSSQSEAQSDYFVLPDKDSDEISVFWPYTVSGTFKGTPIPPTPMLKIMTFDTDTKLITELASLEGVVVRDLPLPASKDKLTGPGSVRGLQSRGGTRGRGRTRRHGGSFRRARGRV